MPCRSGTPEVAIRIPGAARWPSTVGPVQPTLGCAATPTGLSTTTKASSSYTIAQALDDLRRRTLGPALGGGMHDLEERTLVRPGRTWPARLRRA